MSKAPLTHNRPLPKRSRQAVVTALANFDDKNKKRAQKVDLKRTVTSEKTALAVGDVLSARWLADLRALGEMKDKLKAIVDAQPEGKLKYSDQIKAIELLAKLDGLLDKGKQENHLHIHSDQVPYADETALRKQLALLQDEKLSSVEEGDDG